MVFPVRFGHIQFHSLKIFRLHPADSFQASHISQMHDGDILQSLQFSVFLPEVLCKYIEAASQCLLPVLPANPDFWKQ